MRNTLIALSTALLTASCASTSQTNSEAISQSSTTSSPSHYAGMIPEFKYNTKSGEPRARIPPIYPAGGSRSGHCKVSLDVTPKGKPVNVKAISCSEAIFSESSVKAVQKFRYNPKLEDGRPVWMRGEEIKITFRLMDINGNVIPEAEISSN